MTDANKSGSYSATYEPDWTNERPVSTEVIRAVAAVDGRCPTNFDDCLADVVNADALDEFFAPVETDDPAACGVWFEFAGYRVVVHGTGEIKVQEPARASAESRM